MRRKRPFVDESRDAQFDVPVGHSDVPQVGQICHFCKELTRLIRDQATVLRPAIVAGQAYGDCHRLTDGFLQYLDGLAKQSCTVLDAATIFIRPVVCGRKLEVMQQVVVVGIGINNVEARIFRP